MTWLVRGMLALLAAATIGPGVWMCCQAFTGTATHARVVGCEWRYNGAPHIGQFCTARWSIDGREVEGPIEASGSHDVGRRVAVTIRHGTAYRRSLGLPLVLIGLGLPFAGLLVVSVVRRR